MDPIRTLMLSKQAGFSDEVMSNILPIATIGGAALGAGAGAWIGGPKHRMAGGMIGAGVGGGLGLGAGLAVGGGAGTKSTLQTKLIADSDKQNSKTDQIPIQDTAIPLEEATTVEKDPQGRSDKQERMEQVFGKALPNITGAAAAGSAHLAASTYAKHGLTTGGDALATAKALGFSHPTTAEEYARLRGGSKIVVTPDEFHLLPNQSSLAASLKDVAAGKNAFASTIHPILISGNSEARRMDAYNAGVSPRDYEASYVREKPIDMIVVRKDSSTGTVGHEVGHVIADHHKPHQRVSRGALEKGMYASVGGVLLPMALDNDRDALISSAAATVPGIPLVAQELNASRAGAKALRATGRPGRGAYVGVPSYATAAAMPLVAYAAKKLSGGYGADPNTPNDIVTNLRRGADAVGKWF